MEDSLDDLDDDDTDLDHNIQAAVTTEMMRLLPLPGQNTNTTTLAHPLESSLRLLHFIVNSVQAFLNVIKLLCNHQVGLNRKVQVMMKNKIFVLKHIHNRRWPQHLILRFSQLQTNSV